MSDNRVCGDTILQVLGTASLDKQQGQPDRNIFLDDSGNDLRGTVDGYHYLR